ncbi:MAG: hypothetical protein LUE91_05275 [Oscillospiraceae bacterium]|nr:hypothetical protein [Oscillospiraceae bacterium]
MTKKIQVTSESVFAFSYCLYVVFAILATTQFCNFGGAALLINVSKYIAVCGVAASIIMRKILSKKWLFAFSMGVILCIVVMLTNERLSQTIILFLFIICGGMMVSSEKVFNIYLKTVCAVVLLTVFLYIVGIYEYDVVSSSNRMRLYLGFTYTTYLPNYLFHILLVYFALLKKDITIVETGIVLAINYIIYLLTYTNAVYYEVYLLLVLLWTLKLWKGPFQTKTFSICMALIMPVLCALSFFMALEYDASKPIWIALNALLSTRLSLSHNAIQEYGLSLFGSNITWVTGRYGIERTEEYFYVDCSYINTALTFGIIVLMLVIVGFSVLGYKASKEHKYALCISLILLAVHSFSDPQLLDLKYDPFLLILVGCFVRKKFPIPLPEQNGVQESNRRKLRIIFRKKERI